MKGRKIFKIKKNRNKQILSTICIIFLSLIAYYLFFANNNYFIISNFNEKFYIIPDDKGGKKILNQDKKGLHLNYDDDSVNTILNNKDAEYSIQIMSNSDFLLIKNKKKQLINSKDSFFISDELFISIFNSNLGAEYILLYKNFNSRDEALKHCNKYTYFLDKCLIVNVKNLY